MRRHGLPLIAKTMPKIQSAHQRRYAGSNVDNRAAGEIKSRETTAQSSIQQSAFAPNHVSHGTIDSSRPQNQKNCHGAELHAFSKSASDQRRGNNGKHELIY